MSGLSCMRMKKGDKQIYRNENNNIVKSAVPENLPILDLICRVKIWTQRLTNLEYWLLNIQALLGDDFYVENETTFSELLKKHETLEVEISAKWREIFDVQQAGSELVMDPMVASAPQAEQMRERIVALQSAWIFLLQSLAARNSKLKNSEQLVKIMELSDELLIWSEKKFSLILSPEFDHPAQEVDSLQRIFEDFRKSVESKRAVLIHVDQLAASLFGKNPDFDIANGMKQVMHEKLTKLEQTMKMRQIELFFGYETLRLNVQSDYESVVIWSAEKIESLFCNDVGDDLASVNKLRERHSQVEHELMDLGAQISVRLAGYDYLPGLDEATIKDVQAVSELVLEAWSSIAGKVRERRYQLDNSYHIFKLAIFLEEFNVWMNDMQISITKDELPKNSASMQALLAKHYKRKSEIDDRGVYLEAASVSINGMRQLEHVAIENVVEKSIICNKKYNALIALWDSRKNTYEQFRDLNSCPNNFELSKTKQLGRKSFSSENKKSETAISNMEGLEMFVKSQGKKMKSPDQLAGKVIGYKDNVIAKEIENHNAKIEESKQLKQLMD